MASASDISAFRTNYSVMVFTSIAVMAITIYGAIMMEEGVGGGIVGFSAVLALTSAGLFTLFALGSTVAISGQVLRNPLTHAKILRLLNVLSFLLVWMIVGLFVGGLETGYIVVPALVGTVVAFILMRVHILAGWGIVHIATRRIDA